MNYNILIDNKMFSADKDSIDKLIHKIYLLHPSFAVRQFLNHDFNLIL